MKNLIKSLFILFLIPLNGYAESPSASGSDQKSAAQDPLERSRQAIRSSFKEPLNSDSRITSESKKSNSSSTQQFSEPPELETLKQSQNIQSKQPDSEKTVVNKEKLVSVVEQRKNNTKKDPFILNISNDGKKYIKFSGNIQIWASYLNPNPGSIIWTTQTNSYTTGWTPELLIRRLRFEASGMLTDQVFFYSMSGGNNYTINNSDNNNLVNILDLLGEYRFNDTVHVGAGLTGWGAGTLRYSAQSAATQLVFDGPIYQQHQNLSATFGNRNLTAYTKGEASKFKYRLAVTTPLLVEDNQAQINANYAIQSSAAPNLQWSGMLTYQFKDKEANESPYNKGTYLGTKHIFNVAAGFLYQANGTYHLNNLGAVQYNNINVWSVDAFYEAPFSNSNGYVLTLYGAYSKTNYGKNFIRYTGIPNLSRAENFANTLTPSAGNNTGNAFISVGTGNTFYGQVGITLPKSFGTNGRVQLYSAAEAGLFQSLTGTALIIDGGINYYFENNLGPKLSAAYRSRPVFDNNPGNASQIERRGEWLAQLQVNF